MYIIIKFLGCNEEASVKFLATKPSQSFLRQGCAFTQKPKDADFIGILLLCHGLVNQQHILALHFPLKIMIIFSLNEICVVFYLREIITTLKESLNNMVNFKYSIIERVNLVN